MKALEHRCWVEIDLSALERNIGAIRASVPRDVRYISVVKADAYGHGLLQTVTKLMQSGVDIFAVAYVKEAVAIRELGSGWPILILGPILPNEVDSVVDFDLIPVVSSVSEVQMLQDLAVKRGKSISVHLKVDTGMGRVGVWHSECEEIIDVLLSSNSVLLTGVCTHFSCSDTDEAFSMHQRDTFIEIAKKVIPKFPGDVLVHADNSASLEMFAGDNPFNAIRVGLLQFGTSAHRQSSLFKIAVEPVLGFYARVGLIKTLPKGTGVSYGREHVLKKDSTVAVITAGYADGIPTAASGRLSVLLKGKRCSVLGRVTMDQMVVDVTAIEDEISVGDKVTIVGHDGDSTIEITEFADCSKSIPWECLCSISKRVERLYLHLRDL